MSSLKSSWPSPSTRDRIELSADAHPPREMASDRGTPRDVDDQLSNGLNGYGSPSTSSSSVSPTRSISSRSDTPSMSWGAGCNALDFDDPATKGPISHFVAVAVSGEQYASMLRKEVEWRRWHSANLRETVARNLKGYQVTEQNLKAIVIESKERYEANLIALCPDDVDEREMLHQRIGRAMPWRPSQKTSCTMKAVERLLAEGKRSLEQQRPSRQWMWEIRAFAKEMKTKSNRALSAQQREELKLVSLRNEVEMEKLTAHLLRKRLLLLAAQYHGVLLRLRQEYKWWRERNLGLSRLQKANR